MMNSLAAINVASISRRFLPRISQSLFLLQQKRLTHRDAEVILKEKPAKPASLWMEYVKIHRLEILEKNPHLDGNDPRILGMVRELFIALTPDEKAEVEEEYEDCIQDYHRRLHDWNSQLTPEENVAILRFEVDSMKHQRDRTRRRLEKKNKKNGPNQVRSKETGEPLKPGSVFLSFYVKSLVRPEGQPYMEFLKEAAKKWRSLPEEEAKEFWRMYYSSLEEYQNNFDAWLAEKKAEDPSFNRKSWRKGVKMSSEEMIATRVPVKPRSPTFYPDLSFRFDENMPEGDCFQTPALIQSDIEEEVALASALMLDRGEDGSLVMNSEGNQTTRPEKTTTTENVAESIETSTPSSSAAHSTPKVSSSKFSSLLSEESFVSQTVRTPSSPFSSAESLQSAETFVEDSVTTKSTTSAPFEQASPTTKSTTSAPIKQASPMRLPAPPQPLPPARPSRPKNAFFVFKDSFEKSPFVEQKDLVQLIANKWKSMTDRERAPFYERAKREYEEYAENMRKWGENQDWRQTPRAHRDMSSVVREPFVRPFGVFIKTLRKKENETLGQVTRRAAEMWKGLDDEEKTVFKKIFSYGRDFTVCKDEWHQFLAGRERSDYL